MKVTQAEFTISAAGPKQYPEDALPEIALAGRSNVGKSSLINKMLQRKNLARTSSQPGKTQLLNYYRINEALYFVDFPGYGFAKVSKSLREQWGKMIEEYLKHREPLKLILHVIDLRHPPSKDDQAMYSWLKHYNLPVCIVTTKADKIPKTKWQKHLKIVKETLEVDPRDPIIMFSSETGLGKDELWLHIAKAASLQTETEITAE
ncbi:GTP-binding protein [Paenibacillus swuensis]|uniref:Probable GTP-binding protein EngB n=1 Tax=Paenibacillus swuensis TaxID=1178515 RepID=A0A172TK01_9BACL|nr:ribosome biogenesis GTP-binding protein YihA/YsxC [Paenibacillus swuensis]ANE47147.1 GTP-binding protein [Paenibacillus swuensis]